MSTSPITQARLDGIEAGGKMSSADLIVYLQMIMLGDYDSQLADIAQQLQNNIDIKAHYRKQIDKVEQLRREAVGEFDTAEGVWIGKSNIGLFQDINSSATFEARGGEVVEERTGDFGLTKDKDVNTGWRVSHDDLNGIIDHYKGLISDSDNDGQLLQIKLQQVMQKRSMTLETITNIMKKDSEAQLAIVRNIR